MIYATMEAANAAIASKLNEQGFISLDDIKAIIREISCDIANAGSNTNYLLYSGYLDEASKAADVAGAITSRGKGVHIYETEAAKFLDFQGNPVFKDAFRRAAFLEIFGDQNFNINSLPPDEKTAALKKLLDLQKLFLAGTNSSGARVSSDSAWDIVSKGYVRDAKGNLLLVVSGDFYFKATGSGLSTCTPLLKGAELRHVPPPSHRVPRRRLSRHIARRPARADL